MTGAEMRMRMANRGRGSFRAEGATLWLYDVIAADDEEAQWWGGVSPRAFIEALQATAGEVTLRINSPGGSVFGAQAMVTAMRAHGTRIVAQVDSLAASAASVVAAEAAECRIAQGGMLMIHRAWGVALGNGADMRKTADVLDRIDTEIAGTYARRAGETDTAPWLDRMAAETWFSADEAVAAGLADAVISESTQRPQARWDLSAFKAAPRLPEPEPEPKTPAAPAADDDRARRLRLLAARLRA